MRICIFGAGAIGGFLAARLAARGEHQISVVSRGEHLKAIRSHGLTLRGDENEITVQLQASDTPADLGVQDYVIMAVKAHSAPGIVNAMKPLLGRDTAVVTAMNGVPWWYFYKHGGPLEGARVPSVDPDDQQWRLIGPDRVIGSVVYPACEVTSPGVIQHISGDKFTLGEPNNEKSDRVRAIADALIQAGFKAPIRNIRNELWVKLLGNLVFNPLSVLTRATLDVIATDPGTREIARTMMEEACSIGDQLGVRFAVSVEERINGAAKAGAHKTSMLQDLERGRAMEIDALVTAVQELGRLVGVLTPTIDVVLSLVQLRGEVAGCYRRW